MTSRTVVIRRHSCCWQPKTKTKIEKKKTHTAGFIHPVFVVLACLAFAGVLYLYSINRTAVKGIEIQQVEKRIAQAQSENENLKIQAAQLNSLYHLEESSAQLDMSDLKEVNYLEQSGSMALAQTSGAHKN